MSRSGFFSSETIASVAGDVGEKADAASASCSSRPPSLEEYLEMYCTSFHQSWMSSGGDGALPVLLSHCIRTAE